MGLSKKKIVVFLMVIVLCSSMALVYSAPSGTDESTKSLLDNSDSSYGNQPNLTIGSDGNLGADGLFFKMILMVLLVVVFGVAAIYLSKKLLPKFSRLPGKRIQVCETVHLGPRKAIHLIKIGEQRFLIGSTNENITKLADVTGQLSEVDLPEKPINDNRRV
ncbi:MAG: flagellar biosynthetic protein FliO [Planctomycetota bacterium]|jgi:flagellar biosynthetic protein FliO